MPKYHGVGYRELAWQQKQEHIERVLRIVLGTCYGVHKKYAAAASRWLGMVYIDLTAGSGRVRGLPGSPLIALAIARKFATLQLPVRMYLFEQNAVAYRELRRTLAEEPPLPEGSSVTTIHGDASQIVPAMLSGTSEFALPGPGKLLGLVYADPNGLLDGKKSHLRGALAALAADPRCSMLDYLLHLQGGAYKRVAGVIDPCLAPKMPSHDLRSDIQLVRRDPLRNHLWLTEPEGRDQWTFFLASHYEPLAKRLREFASSQTLEGQSRWRTIRHTKNPGLWRAQQEKRRDRNGNATADDQQPNASGV